MVASDDLPMFLMFPCMSAMYKGGKAGRVPNLHLFNVYGIYLKKGPNPKCLLVIPSSDAAWLAEFLRHFVFTQDSTIGVSGFSMAFFTKLTA